MWFHQRTGPDTGISYGFGTVFAILFVVFAAIGGLGWWSLAVIAAIGAFMVLRRQTELALHRDEHELQLNRCCRYCAHEVEQIRARERLTELDRLRAKYRA